MMTYFVFAIRDRSANVYGRPFADVSVESAKRHFMDEINHVHPQNVMNRHPEDFDLYVLGTYDDDSGEFNTGAPKQVAIGKEMKREQG